MLDMLGDIKRDLEIFAEGRGTNERYWTVRSALWKLEDLGRKLDANYKEVVEPEVMPDTPPSHRLADKPPTLRLTDNRALSPKNLF
jgi:hypothetical protein